MLAVAVGIAIARWIGIGRFYSQPLGTEHISDTDIIVSALFWIGLSSISIQLIFRKKKRAA
jgi:hypothetical protein